MKVALVVYSQTGNTRSVAEQIRSRLIGDGHVADYIPIEHEPKKDASNPMEKVVFKSLPDLGGLRPFCVRGIYGSFQSFKSNAAVLKPAGTIR